jgi:hypothetical protein
MPGSQIPKSRPDPPFSLFSIAFVVRVAAEFQNGLNRLVCNALPRHAAFSISTQRYSATGVARSTNCRSGLFIAVAEERLHTSLFLDCFFRKDFDSMAMGRNMIGFIL